MEIQRTKNNQDSPLKKIKVESLTLLSSKSYCHKTLSQLSVDITIISRIDYRAQKQIFEYVNIDVDKGVTAKQWGKRCIFK